MVCAEESSFLHNCVLQIVDTQPHIAFSLLGAILNDSCALADRWKIFCQWKDVWLHVYVLFAKISFTVKNIMLMLMATQVYLCRATPEQQPDHFWMFRRP